MIKSILLHYIYTLFFIYLMSMPNILLGSRWIYQADLLETFTKDNQEIKELRGSVIIKKDDITLTTNKAIIYSSDDRLELFDDIIMINKQDTILCDSLYYFPPDINEEYFATSGSIKLLNNNRLLTSDSLYFWPGNDSIYALGNVYLDDRESTLNSGSLKYWKTDGYNGYSFIADDGVTLHSSDNKIKGQTVMYTDSTQNLVVMDSTKTPYGASIINNSQKVFGENILIHFKDSIIQNIHIGGDPIIYSKIEAQEASDTPLKDFEDEMYGEIIDIQYEDNEPKVLKIKGMANSRYNVIDNLLHEGYNEVSGDTIVLSFLDKIIDRIQVIGGCRGAFYPNILSSDLDTIIYYSAERIDYRINEDLNYFYNNAIINHSDTELKSEYIEVNWETNQLLSYRIDSNKPRVISADNRNPMVGDTLTYNLISKKGIVKKGKTELNDAFYHGEEIINDNSEDVYSYNGLYTSCSLDYPHYYFQSNKMKIVHDKHIIARPITLYIRDLPIIGFPFAILPNKGGKRKSGWIMPSFGYSDRNGTYFHNLGYYFVVNDYSDMKFLSNFYDRRGLKLNSYLRYKKRYQYNGNISSIIVRNIIADENGLQDISNIFSNMVTQSWSFKWKHSHTIDPSQHFNLDINYVSENNFYQQDQVGYDVDTRLNQNMYSAIYYGKKWSNSNNSLSIHLSDSYNLLGEDYELTSGNSEYSYRFFNFPNIQFSHGSRLLFGNGLKWYNSIYYSLNSNFRFTKNNAHYLYYSGIDTTLVNDNEVYSYNSIDTTFYNNGINHTMSVSGSYKILKWFNISPRLNLLESWIYGYKEPLIDQEGNFIDNKFTVHPNQFKRRLTGYLSISLNTKLYGMFSARIFNLDAIRHIISPSITYSYKPDFSQSSIWGLQTNYFRADESGEKFDLFGGSLVPSTSAHESKSYTFKIINDFHGKFYNNDEYIKKSLFSASTSLSYRPTDQEFQWSTISTSIYKNTRDISLDISLSHDLYKLNDGVRVNSYASSPRLTYLSSGINFNLFGKKIEGVQEVLNDTVSIPHFYEPIVTDYNLWEADFSFRGTMYKKLDSNNKEYWDKIFWLAPNMKFHITTNWEIAYNARFDLINHEILSHNIIIARPLHCWLFNFRWYPGVGEDNFGSGFELLIRVKNPDLQDIRLKHNSGSMFGF